MAEIARVTPTHEAMMDWMLLNPGATLAQMGAFFGYSVSWLSQVVNSDVFRAKFEERRGEVESRIAADIPTKMRTLALVAMDKLTQHVERAEDPNLLLTTADKMLHRLGYAPQKAPTSVNVTQNNTNTTVALVDRSALEAAQERIRTLGVALLPNLPPQSQHIVELADANTLPTPAAEA